MRRVLALLLTLACERDAATVSPDRRPRSQRDRDSDEVFLRVEGQGATEDEAYAEAVRALAVELLGDARWLDVAPVELHQRPAVLEAERSPVGVQVRLQLSHSEAAAALTAFADTEPTVTAPEPWRDTIFAYLFAHIREHACVRKRALFDVECETGTTGDADAAMQTLTGAVSLASTLAGGVPVDGRGRPLHDPGVLALWNGAPAAGVPLRIEVGDGVRRMHSGEDGRVQLQFPKDEAWPSRVRVSVDVEALLGPKQEAWRPAPLEIRSRKLDLRRWAVVIVDEDRREIGDGPREAFVAKMRAAGFGDPKPIRNPKKIDLSGLIEQTGGGVDMLVVLEVRSAYASRMGGGRVWYEAAGGLDAINPWVSEDNLPSFRVTVTASGIGDARAELAARTSVCADAAEKLVAALKKQS